MQRAFLSELKASNQEHLATRADQKDLLSRINGYELAFKMQQSAPESVDLKDETQETLDLYGVGDKKRTDDFGRRCLIARRLVERGVRCIQLYSGGAHNDDNWDAHGDLEKNHNFHAGNTDQPIAALLTDLKRRGLLDETLVVWGGEFGRQPTAEYAMGSGRDHNAYGFTMWMAGGGIKGGVTVGTTDEIGSAAVEKTVPCEATARDAAQSPGPRPESLELLLRRPRSKARRRGRSPPDRRDHGVVWASAHINSSPRRQQGSEISAHYQLLGAVYRTPFSRKHDFLFYDSVRKLNDLRQLLL